MNEQTWKLLSEHYGPQAEYIDGGYYRLRPFQAGVAELTYYIGGPCGETLYHPKITLEKVAGQIQPVELLDNYQTPVRYVKLVGNEATLTAACNQLVNRFLAAKNLPGSEEQ